MLHVLAVVGWIGGVWFVTGVVMPTIRRHEPPSRRLGAFHRIESGFASQARWWVLLAGGSGMWMVWRGHMWPRFADRHFWWMHAMLSLWAVFFLMLFMIEPLFLHRRMAISQCSEADFDRLVMAHRVLSLAGLVTVAGAVAGAHGLL